LAPIEHGHLSAALVHLANASYRLGRTLNFDPETERVIADEEANRLLRGDDRGWRAPFIIPEHVQHPQGRGNEMETTALSRGERGCPDPALSPARQPTGTGEGLLPPAADELPFMCAPDW
jgi:hypothetical protein